MPELIKVERVSTVRLPSVVFLKEKNNKFIYKNKWTEEFYVVYRDSDGLAIVETWHGGCDC